MWDNPFSMDMLTSGSKIAVNCPSEELERELAALLDERGIKYPGGDSLSEVTGVWGKYGEDFCYYISGKEAKAWRGPKSSTTQSPWRTYEKYTFHGEPATEIDDDSFFSIIGR